MRSVEWRNFQSPLVILITLYHPVSTFRVAFPFFVAVDLCRCAPLQPPFLSRRRRLSGFGASPPPTFL